jgi:acyl-coenzyme A synthetase/AMP-(fatty) acid ligase
MESSIGNNTCLTKQQVDRPDRHTDVFWCTADIGWITGHSYICYDPTVVGGTQVMFEDVPTTRTPAASGK